MAVGVQRLLSAEGVASASVADPRPALGARRRRQALQPRPGRLLLLHLRRWRWMPRAEVQGLLLLKVEATEGGLRRISGHPTELLVLCAQRNNLLQAERTSQLPLPTAISWLPRHGRTCGGGHCHRDPGRRCGALILRGFLRMRLACSLLARAGCGHGVVGLVGVVCWVG